MNSRYSNVQIWDVAQERVVRDIRGPDSNTPYKSTMSRDGTIVAFSAGSEARKVILQETHSGKTIATIEPDIGDVQSLNITPDNKYLTIGGDDGRTVTWNLIIDMSHQRFGGYKKDVQCLCSNGQQQLGYLLNIDGRGGPGVSNSWRPEILNVQTSKKVSLKPLKRKLYESEVPLVVDQDYAVGCKNSTAA